LVGVLATIDLDHQLSRGAGEVGDAMAYRMLPAEFPRQAAFAERAPETPLDVGSVLAKLAPKQSSRA
jgi:hypothetical protein